MTPSQQTLTCLLSGQDQMYKEDWGYGNAQFWHQSKKDVPQLLRMWVALGLSSQYLSAVEK